jgi:hypothetical protein
MQIDQPTRRNTGGVSIPEMPREKWCAGVIAVMYDEEGNYSTIFKAFSMPELPIPEIREEVGSLAAHAWSVANCAGMEL